ncbi:MAG: fibronectin type III domain-containing protein [Verrucomicrobiales bacterium]|nr:fibronectin type III domain-containing protein [Verrucomicrobiales bacterium]
MTALPASGTGSVTMAWNPSTDASVVGYNLYYGGASGVYTNKISTAITPNAIVSGLMEGMTYYFALTAYDISGLESPLSNEATYSVPISGQPPVLGSPSFSGGRFSFTVPGVAGSQYAVEASANLVTWVRVVTNTAPFTFVETNSSQFAKRFYRTVNLSSLAAANTAVQPVVLRSPSLAGGNFSFAVPGNTGAKYAVEASVNLVNWARVLTNTAPFTFVDTNSSQFGKRFYRTVSLP